ncbi:SCO-spondin, partial [Trichonephila clavata]
KASNNGCIAACRPIDGCSLPYVWRDYYNCVPKDECTCIMVEGNDSKIIAPNEIFSRDCEVCQCHHDDLNCQADPRCATTLPSAQNRFLIINITNEDCWTDWINIDKPTSGGGDFEKLNKIRQRFEFCPDPVQIECRTAESKQRPFDVGQVVTCDLQSGLQLHHQPTTPPPPPTLEPGLCVYGWTEWFNNHQPDNRGDYESIQSSRVNHIFCANDMNICHRVRQIGTTATSLLQHGVHCDLQYGLICSQGLSREYEACWDYEVRFFCDCPTPAPVTEIETLPPIKTEAPSLKSCSYWSEWINEHHPTKPGEGGTKKGSVKTGGSVIRGDTEKVMLLKLQREYNFCLDGIVSDIECREADTDLDYTETGDKKLACTLVGGFRCRGKDQPERLCKDYKIRYFCSCTLTEEIPVTPIVTTPTVYIVVDGPKPLPDSYLKASSSKTPEMDLKVQD